jgi:hypothetical protein
MSDKELDEKINALIERAGQKIVTFVQSTPPEPTSKRPLYAGDTWVVIERTNERSEVRSMSRYDGVEWVPVL